jgi:hypothetical protein
MKRTVGINCIEAAAGRKKRFPEVIIAHMRNGADQTSERFTRKLPLAQRKCPSRISGFVAQRFHRV